MNDDVDNSKLLEDPKTRHCLRGHGPMELMPELLALQAVTRSSRSEPMTALAKAYGVRKFVCQFCGSIELVDEDILK